VGLTGRARRTAARDSSAVSSTARRRTGGGQVLLLALLVTVVAATQLVGLQTVWDLSSLARDLHVAQDAQQQAASPAHRLTNLRDLQVLALGGAAAAVVLAATLGLSLRRAVRGDLDSARQQLVREQLDRSTAQEVARRSERRFAALVRQGDDVILVLSPERLITFATPAAARLAGLDDPAHLLGLPFLDLVAVIERPAATAALDRAYSADGATVRVDLRVCDLPGVDRPPAWLSVALTDLRSDPAVTGVVVNAHDITERAVRVTMLEHLAFHDRITGLPNRLAAERHLDGAGPGERFSIVVLDLDKFGALNDDIGPVLADAALVAVAAALELRSFPSAFVAHFGADVFAVITPSWVGTPAGVARRAGRVLAEGVEVHDRRLTLTAGMGAVASIGMRGNDALRLAESAMYDAKRSGDGSVVVHDEARLEAMARRADLLDGLGGAAAAGELLLHHQPLISLRTGLVTGTEALLRWQRSTEQVGPVEFVPMAEEAGLIVPLGSWVLRQACADVAALDAAGRASLRVSVNVSPRQLATPDFVATVATTMAELGTDPARIVLELTESAIGDDSDRVARRLGELRAAGHSIALDDFGTGYSSLSHLVRMPVDTVKLDRSFIADVETSARTRQMVRAVVKVCHDLGLSVTVEGIETPGQLDEVRLAGCDTAQGFLLARPQTMAELLSAMAGAHPVLTGVPPA